MRRSAVTLAVGAVGVLAAATVAACSHDDRGDAGPVSSAASSSNRVSAPSSTAATSLPPTSSASPLPSATNAPTAPSTTGSVVGPAVPDVPAVPAGAAGAYTVVVTGGGAVTTPVDRVTCSPDGSLTATGLQLSVGGAALRLVDVAPVGTLDVPGRTEADAAGGTFRGATDTAAVSFTWTC